MTAFNKTSGYDARVNLGISAQLLKGLTYDGRFHYQRDHSKNEQFYGEDSYRVRSELVSYATVDAATGAPVFALPVSGGYYDEVIKSAVAKDGLLWPQLNMYERLEGKPEINKAYDVSAFPTKFLIGKDGKIIAKYVGDSSAIDSKLEELLGK